MNAKSPVTWVKLTIFLWEQPEFLSQVGTPLGRPRSVFAYLVRVWISRTGSLVWKQTVVIITKATLNDAFGASDLWQSAIPNGVGKKQWKQTLCTVNLGIIDCLFSSNLICCFGRTALLFRSSHQIAIWLALALTQQVWYIMKANTFVVLTFVCVCI